jgi:hypothetical protein
LSGTTVSVKLHHHYATRVRPLRGGQSAAQFRKKK